MGKIIFCLCTALSMLTFAGGGSDAGNGGGVICVNGVCKTLTESGLRISPEFNGVWLPDSRHYDKVEDRILQRVNLQRSVQEEIIQRVFSNSDHFKRVSVIDPQKFEEIKELYRKVAFDAGYPFDPNTFKIVAFSSDDTPENPETYLLPDFFQLKFDQQVEILIHEGLYRGKPTGHLKYILQFESSIADSDVGDIDIVGCRDNKTNLCINQSIVGYKLGMISKKDLIMQILTLAGSRSPDLEGGDYNGENRFDATPLAKSIEDAPDQKKVMTLNRLMITRLGKVDSRIPYIFSKVTQLNFQFDVYYDGDADSVNNFLYYDYKEDGDSGLAIDKYPGRQYYELTDVDQIQILLPD